MSEKEVSSQYLFTIALITGIIAIMVVNYYPVLTPIAVILVWPAFISGANSVRQVARYGLGTGTSSIGYWGTAVGTTMALLSQFFNTSYSPYIGISSALVVGAVTGIAAQKIIKMKIPVMIQESAFLSSSTAIIAVFLMSVLSVSSSGMDSYVTFPLVYIAITLAVLHPFNGSMGAGENQKRTLRLSAVEASMTTGMFGMVAVIFSDALFLMGISMIIISLAGFLVFLKRWYSLVKEDTYEFKWTGYPPAEH